VVTNPFLQVFPGDIIQSWAFIPLPSHLGFMASIKRFRAYLRSQFFLPSCEASAPRSDVPLFLEADELSLTSVLLYDPSFGSLLSFTQVGPAPYLSFRLYN
jgi:hypothetical protein